MSWSDTHRYYAALRRIEGELDRGADVRWQGDWEPLFGSPSGLRSALLRRWRLLVEAQIDVAFGEDGRPSRQLRALAAAHPGLVRLAAGHDPRWGGLLRPTATFAGAR